MPQNHNYLSLSNGCQVIDSSPTSSTTSPVQHILTNAQKQIWLITSALPAFATISTDHMRQIPAQQRFNKFGVFCWHDYPSNPKVIQLYWKADGDWVLCGKLRMTLVSGWQHCIIKQIDARAVKALKIRILQNWGEQNNTYINQISLSYSAPQQAYPPNQSMRDTKTYSEYSKLTSTEKEVVKLTEKIKELERESKEMKDIIHKQQKQIALLADRVSKIQKKPSTDRASIDRVNQRVNQTKYDRVNQTKYDRVNESKNDRVRQTKKDRKVMEQATLKLNLKQQQQSTLKQKKGFSQHSHPNKMSPSQPSLSQYSHPISNSINTRNRSDLSASSMLQKLNKLIILREQKRIELRRRQKEKSKGHQIEYQQQQIDEYYDYP